MNSISVRLLLAAALVMALFIGLTTIAIQQTVDQRAEQARFERLQGQIYALLGATEIAADGTIDVSASDLPNPQMRQPMSGIYAEVRNNDVQQMWRSPSLTTQLPRSSEGAIGQWKFSSEDSDALGPLFILRFAVEWLLPDGKLTAYQFIVGDSRVEHEQRRNVFNRNLWISMLTMGGLLLMSIALILAWGLRPLRRISSQLNEIENGQRESLPANVPAELHPLTSRINALIASERGRQKRYRQTLDDLAHSLKTPLSVLRNIQPEATDIEIERQADRMDEIVTYHIKRADAGRKLVLTPPIALQSITTRITRSLQKIYKKRNIIFENKITALQKIRIEEADAMEILGNLLDNACKYGAKRIYLTAEEHKGSLTLFIDDDGPGFPDGKQGQLIDRGVRADTRQEGQGIGLAITNELIENYGGKLALSESPLGGARASITMPGS